MPSRRRLLRTSGAALAVALAGCLNDDDGPGAGTQTGAPDVTDGTSLTDGTTTTSDETTRTTVDGPRLTARTLEPNLVRDSATVAVLTTDLVELVREAAAADERVDLLNDGTPNYDENLALGEFESIQFRGETYDPSTSFANFAGEPSYGYEAEPSAESEADGAVVEYDELTDRQQDVADRLVSGEGYYVGTHEEKPEFVRVFETNDFLRTDEGLYRLTWVVGDNAAHHMLTLDRAEPRANAAVVTVLDRAVPSSIRETVRTAVENGSTSVSEDEREALSSFLDDVGYVVTVDAVAEVELVGGG